MRKTVKIIVAILSVVLPTIIISVLIAALRNTVDVQNIDATLVDAPKFISAVVTPCTVPTCRNTVDVTLTYQKKDAASRVLINRIGLNATALNYYTSAFTFTEKNLAAGTTYTYAIKYLDGIISDTRAVTVDTYANLCLPMNKDNDDGICVAQCNGHGVRNISRVCECYTGFKGALCQFTDQLTCNGAGTVDDQGTCTCDLTHTGINCATVVLPTIFSIAATDATATTADITLTFTGKPGNAYAIRLGGTTDNLTEGVFTTTASTFVHTNQPKTPRTYQVQYIGSTQWVTSELLTYSRYTCDGTGACVLTASKDPATTFASAAECACYSCQAGVCAPTPAGVAGTTLEACRTSSCEWSRYACNGTGGCVLTASKDPATTFASAAECACYSCQAGVCAPTPAGVAGTTLDACRSSSCEVPPRYACNGAGECVQTPSTDPATTFASVAECKCYTCAAGLCSPTAAGVNGTTTAGCNGGCSLFGNNNTVNPTFSTGTSLDIDEGGLSTNFPKKVWLTQSGSLYNSGFVKFTDASYTSPRFKYYPMFVFTASSTCALLTSGSCNVQITGGWGSDTAQVQVVLVPWGNTTANTPDPATVASTTSRNFGVYTFSSIPVSTDIIAAAGDAQYAGGQTLSDKAAGFNSHIAYLTPGKTYAIAAEVLVATDDYIALYWTNFSTTVPAVVFISPPQLPITMPNLVVKSLVGSTVYSTVLNPNGLITMQAGVNEIRENELVSRLWFDSVQTYTNPSSTIPSLSVGIRISQITSTTTTISILMKLGVYQVPYSTSAIPVALDVPKNIPARYGWYYITTSSTIANGATFNFADTLWFSATLLNSDKVNSRTFYFYESGTQIAGSSNAVTSTFRLNHRQHKHSSKSCTIC